jgi:RNA polymerase sigma factor (sigma-70 family)
MIPTPDNRVASSDGDATDQALVERALEGNRDALRELVERHQPFVYNIALKVFGGHEDARDLTQEVFVKVITSLKTFRYESALRTWLYRITVNHFLRTRRRGQELTISGFEPYFDEVAAVADEEPSAEHGINDETTEELRIRCTSGMLMCLDREQRLTFVLGAMFGLSHHEAADLLGISAGNFRVRLHRARRDLYSWMNRRCGLVNTQNPCRCRNKTQGFVKLGLVDPKRLVFNTSYLVRIEALTERDASRVMASFDELHEQTFLEHGFQQAPSQLVDQLLDDTGLRQFLDLGPT